MSVDMSGLTAAWLDAVLRTQARPTMMPERPWAEKNDLADVIEGALRTGGTDSRDPDWVDPLAPGQVVDINI
jgi:hypothetical protein